METIDLYFEWETCSADMGEFRQRSQIFKPENIRVVVKLPLDPKYFHNPEVGKYFEAFKQWELGFGDKPQIPELDPILTPQGANKAKELLQEAFITKHPYSENQDEEEIENPEEWE